MAHIVKFAVDGLAGRTHTYALELDRAVNIFFGVNGSGKTSLLRILHSAMSGDADELYRVPFSSAEVVIYSKDYDTEFTRRLTKPESVRQSEEQFAENAERPDAPEETDRRQADAARRLEWTTVTGNEAVVDTARWQHVFLRTSRLYESEGPEHFGARTVRRGGDAELDQRFARYMLYLWHRFNFQITSQVNEAQEAGLQSILRAVLKPRQQPTRTQGELTSTEAYLALGAFLERQGAKSLLGRRADFEAKYESDPALRSVAADIRGVEGAIERAAAPRNALEAMIKAMFVGPKSIDFGEQIGVTYQGAPIGLTSLSSGEKHVLRLLVEVLLARDNSFLVDEPELSLHVDWQRELVGRMRLLNPHMQIIAATHSPDIMANIPDRNIHGLR